MSTMPSYSVQVPDLATLERIGARIAAALVPGLTIYLRGDLGAGKTALVGAILRARGHSGAVKSPTYTLVEPYRIGTLAIYHFDLYRLRQAEELEFLGIRDYVENQGVLLIEWPQRGAGVLPPADIDVDIRTGNDARELNFRALSEAGTVALSCLATPTD